MSVGHRARYTARRASSSSRAPIELSARRVGGLVAALAATALAACAGDGATGAAAPDDGSNGPRANATRVTIALGEFEARTPRTRGPVASAVAAGAAHTCAVMTDETVWCWGDNRAGQLGYVSLPTCLADDSGEDGTPCTPDPLRVESVDRVAEVAAGARHTCVRRTDGTVLCWGDNSSGQLGDGTLKSREAPDVVPRLRGVASLTAGRAHTCARLLDGDVYCWGENRSGQLGDGSVITRVHPTRVPALRGVAELSAGRDHTCARLLSGAPMCWGDNSSGQLGDGTAEAVRTEPTPVAGVSAAWMIAAGASHTCAVDNGGAVVCWGGESGLALPSVGRGVVGCALSSGGARCAAHVATIAGVTDVASLAVGSGRACAATGDGAARCWTLGAGSAGAPSVLAGASGAARIAVGEAHACAALRDGSLRCWGANSAGQLGDGTTDDRAAPAGPGASSGGGPTGEVTPP